MAVNTSTGDLLTPTVMFRPKIQKNKFDTHKMQRLKKNLQF